MTSHWKVNSLPERAGVPEGVVVTDAAGTPRSSRACPQRQLGKDHWYLWC